MVNDDRQRFGPRLKVALLSGAMGLTLAACQGGALDQQTPTALQPTADLMSAEGAPEPAAGPPLAAGHPDRATVGGGPATGAGQSDEQTAATGQIDAVEAAQADDDDDDDAPVAAAGVEVGADVEDDGVQTDGAVTTTATDDPAAADGDEVETTVGSGGAIAVTADPATADVDEAGTDDSTGNGERPRRIRTTAGQPDGSDSDEADSVETTVESDGAISVSAPDDPAESDRDNGRASAVNVEPGADGSIDGATTEDATGVDASAGGADGDIGSDGSVDGSTSNGAAGGN